MTSESSSDVAAVPEEIPADAPIGSTGEIPEELPEVLSEMLAEPLPDSWSGDSDAEPVVANHGEPISYEQFGANFIHMVLHQTRILESIDRLLGEKIELGPMGAGPGRIFAKARATGWFRDTYGNAVLDDLLKYRVYLPIDVDFEVVLATDVHQFRAEVVLPLTLTVRVEQPLMIVWDITPPQEEEVTIKVETGKRRSALLQRVAGLDGELRRFLIRVIEKELEKPHIHKATHLDMSTIIDTAWPVIADQFLPVDDVDQADQETS